MPYSNKNQITNGLAIIGIVITAVSMLFLGFPVTDLVIVVTLMGGSFGLAKAGMK